MLSPINIALSFPRSSLPRGIVTICSDPTKQLMAYLGKERIPATFSSPISPKRLYQILSSRSQEGRRQFFSQFFPLVSRLSDGEQSLIFRSRVLGGGGNNSKAPEEAQDHDLMDLTSPEEALKSYTKNLAMIEASSGEETAELATCYYDVGLSLFRLGKYNQALNFYQQALDIRLRVLGKNHPDVAHCYHKMALCYDQLGDRPQAFKLNQDALAIRLKALGKNHIDVAKSYNNLGCSLLDSKEIFKAQECFQNALAINLNVLAKNHPNVASSYLSCGICEAERGYHKKAIELYKIALSIWKEAYGEDHYDVALCYSNMAASATPEGANPCCERALKILWKIGDTNVHSNEPIRRNCLIGYCLMKLGRFEEAQTYYQKELEIQIKAHGKEHREVAEIRKYLHNCLKRQRSANLGKRG